MLNPQKVISLAMKAIAHAAIMVRFACQTVCAIRVLGVESVFLLDLKLLTAYTNF